MEKSKLCYDKKELERDKDEGKQRIFSKTLSKEKIDFVVCTTGKNNSKLAAYLKPPHTLDIDLNKNIISQDEDDDMNICDDIDPLDYRIDWSDETRTQIKECFHLHPAKDLCHFLQDMRPSQSQRLNNFHEFNNIDMDIDFVDDTQRSFNDTKINVVECSIFEC